jgi:acetyl-CoA synthetase
VCRFSNVLKSFGLRKGDAVAIYLPMIPEAVIAILSCARLGIIHSVIFAGFSAASLSDRVNDAKCSLIITSDQGKRAGKAIHLKQITDEGKR